MMLKTKREYMEKTFSIDIRQQLDDAEIAIRVFPHKPFPVVLQTDKGRTIHTMNYSLIPHWSKDAKPRFATYNARIETIEEKPTWRDPLAKKRCLVGLTSFFESCYDGTHAGNVVQFKSKSDQIMVVAGIYDEWVDKNTGEVIESFAIVTREPTTFIRETGHDRCPFFLDKKAWTNWLDPHPHKAHDMKLLLENSFANPDLTVEIERPLKPGWEKR